MKIAMLGLTLLATGTCNAFLAPSTAFRRTLHHTSVLAVVDEKVIEVTAAGDSPKVPNVEQVVKTVSEAKQEAPVVIPKDPPVSIEKQFTPEAPKIEARVEEKILAKESSALDKSALPAPPSKSDTPKVELPNAEGKVIAQDSAVEKSLAEVPTLESKVEDKLVAKEPVAAEKVATGTQRTETQVEEKLIAKESPQAVEKPASEKIIAKDTTATVENPLPEEPKVEEKLVAKDTAPTIEKLAAEAPKNEQKLVAKESTPSVGTPATETPKMEEKLVSAKAPEVKDAALKVDHAVAKASSEPLQIQTSASKAAVQPEEAQEVAAPFAKKITDKATETPIPSEISDALKAVDNIKVSIAQAKTDMEAGTLGKTAYVEKLEEFTAQLNQIDQKMQGVITARSSDIEKLNLMLSKLEEQGGAAGEKSLSKIGDMAMDIASSGVFDFF